MQVIASVCSPDEASHDIATQCTGAGAINSEGATAACPLAVGDIAHAGVVRWPRPMLAIHRVRFLAPLAIGRANAASQQGRIRLRDRGDR
jgi:hypothetical protein